MNVESGNIGVKAGVVSEQWKEKMVNSRITKKYLGVSLVFAYKEKGEKLMAHIADFVIKRGSWKDVVKASDSIGKRRSWGVRGRDKEFNEYLGIYEIFGIAGPLKHGAMLGQHSFWSYKKESDVKKLLRQESEFSLYKMKVPASKNLYIAEIIYYHGKGIRYKSRRALCCLGVVESRRKEKVMEKAIELAHSLEFKRKITLKDYNECFDQSGLEFIGIADIRPILEELRVNNCFQIAYKRFKKFSLIRHLVPPRDKLKELYYLFSK